MLAESLLFPGFLTAITAMILLFPEIMEELWTFKFILSGVWMYAGMINTWVPMSIVCYFLAITVLIWHLKKYLEYRNKRIEGEAVD
jgi:hypothetical protein